MDSQNNLNPKPIPAMVFSCSGAADVGAITDQAARRLSKEKTASMCCTAAVAAEIPDIMEKVYNTKHILALDGCDKECTGVILSQAGLSNVSHLQLDNLGMKKGESPVTEDRINMVMQVARDCISE